MAKQNLYPTLSVAKVTPTFAANNDLTFQDTDGNYVVGMCFTKYLYISEYVPMDLLPATDYTAMPVNPTKPIVH